MNRLMHDHPVKLVVTDDLRRSRLTVVFRLLLAIPHIVWILLWSVVVLVAVIFGWLAALAAGRLPAGLHRFFCAYIRYSAHFFGYLTLAANPLPVLRRRGSGTRSTSSCPEPHR